MREWAIKRQRHLVPLFQVAADDYRSVTVGLSRFDERSGTGNRRREYK
jgi:hypothetical protein